MLLDTTARRDNIRSFQPEKESLGHNDRLNESTFPLKSDKQQQQQSRPQHAHNDQPSNSMAAASQQQYSSNSHAQAINQQPLPSPSGAVQVSSLIQRLVAHQLPQATPLKQQQTVQLMLRLLAARLPSNTVDAHTLQHQIKKRVLAQQHNNNASSDRDSNATSRALRADELCHAFYRQNNAHSPVTRKLEFLQLLAALHDCGSKHVSSSIGAAASNYSFPLVVQPQNPIATPHQRPSHIAARHSAFPKPDVPAELSPCSGAVSEQRLLRDCLFALQGIEGQFVRFDAQLQRFTLNSAAVRDALQSSTVSRSQIALVERCCQLGVQYKRVQHYMDSTAAASQQQHQHAASQHRRNALMQTRCVGRLEESFRSAVQQELNSYYRLCATLEAQCPSAVTSSSSASADQRVTVSGTDLTLIRLYVTTLPALQRMTTLARITDTIMQSHSATVAQQPPQQNQLPPIRGAQLLSLLVSHLQHGAPPVHRLVGTLLRSVLQCFAGMLHRWLTMGQVMHAISANVNSASSQYENEFFIQQLDVASKRNSQSTDELRMSGTLQRQQTVRHSTDTVWHSLFALDTSQLPSFMPVELAQRILHTGKTLHLIRTCCADSSYVNAITGGQLTLDEHFFNRSIAMSDDIAANAAATSSSSFLRLDLTQLDALIVRLHQQTNRSLMQHLHVTFALQHHMMLLKRFLLLSQGDFVEHLYDVLEPLLSQNARTTMNLKGQVQNAVSGALKQWSSQQSGAVRQSSNAAAEQRLAAFAKHGASVESSQLEAPQSTDELTLLRCIQVRMPRPASDDEAQDGWTVFSLDFQLQDQTSPLSLIFTDHSRRCYLKLFHFLWRLKRCERLCAASWTRHMAAQHMLQSATQQSAKSSSILEPKTNAQHAQLLQLVQRGQQLRHAMQHALQALVSHCMYQGVERHFALLQSQLTDCATLEELQRVHSRYQSRLLESCMLQQPSDTQDAKGGAAPPHPSPQQQLTQQASACLSSLLLTVQTFCQSDADFYASLTDELHSMRHVGGQSESFWASQLMLFQLSVTQQRQAFDSHLASFLQRRRQMEQLYQRTSAKSAIEDSHHRAASADLSGGAGMATATDSLVLQLDFNDFYQHRIVQTLGATQRARTLAAS